MGRRKILVAYASEFGSTMQIAAVIGAVLSDSGVHVDVREINSIEGVERYDAIVIGGPIQYDKWMQDVTNFLRDHQDIFQNVPIACFFTCLTLSQDSPKALRQARGYAKGIRGQFPQIEFLALGQFAGALDYSKMSVLFRSLSKVLFLFLGVREGDYRDWDKISDWARSIKAAL